jgi:hypothetical protein
VAQQKNPNRFPSDARNQFAFDGFLRHQAHRPTGATFRRTTAYHCNQALFLALVEHFRCTWPLSFIQCLLQTSLPVTTVISEDWIWRLATVKFPYLKRTETMPEAHVGERFTGWSQTNR